ncbi:MAG: aliphatic sulfonate ABC transporter substrate-binding protein [Caldilineaceae bacterium]|nr:aliphatic sulfonate ABC transporter substrate-binding protein [Caldilineaceae bacterium]
MRRLLPFLLIGVIVLASGCTAVAPAAPAGQAPAEPAAVTVRIGTQPWIGYGPWWIAQEQGLFDKHGIQAELIDFVTDTEVNAAFASGNMDVANVASHTAIKLYANGVDLRVVLLEDASYEADAILAPAAITSFADLAGKRVAYEEGSTSDLLLNFGLAENGLSIQDIEPAPMPAADAGAALIAGQVDASVTYEPYITEAMGQNPELAKLYTGAARPGLISDVLIARTEFATQNPETMGKLMAIWDEAIAFLRENPDEGRAIIATAVGSAPEELTTAFDGVRFYDVAENAAEFNPESGSFYAIFADIQDVSLSIGLIEESVDLDGLIDTSYLSQ